MPRSATRLRPIEILVAIALLAIVAAAFTPLVLRVREDTRLQRARADAEALGRAILAFRLDLGLWPVSNDGEPFDAGEVSRLVGLPRRRIARARIPGGDAATPGSGSWDGGGNGGTVGALEDFLVLNLDADTDPLYPTVGARGADARAGSGWNGPYLPSIPSDPWGRPFVVNVRYLDGADVEGATAVEAENHAVFVISAGQNGFFETSFDDATPLANDGVGGDDVGWMIEGRRTAP